MESREMESRDMESQYSDYGYTEFEPIDINHLDPVSFPFDLASFPRTGSVYCLFQHSGRMYASSASGCPRDGPESCRWRFRGDDLNSRAELPHFNQEEETKLRRAGWFSRASKCHRAP